MTILQVFKSFKYSIAFVVSFILLENISWIVEPNFFGKLLDAMIDHFTDHEKKVDYIIPLLIWIFIYMLNLGGGTFSRFFGGRIYARVYAEIASKVIIAAKKNNQPLSIMLAHAELAKDYITFLKERIPEITWQFSAMFGAIAALFFYDWRIAAVCLLVVIPMGVMNRLYRKNVIKQQKKINDTREDLYRVFEEKDTAKIQGFYFSLIRPQQIIARWNSLNYGIIKFVLLIIFIVVLFICVEIDDFSTGKTYAVVAYLWTFISSTEYLPTLMESIISVRELSNRLKEEKVLEVR